MKKWVEDVLLCSPNTVRCELAKYVKHHNGVSVERMERRLRVLTDAATAATKSLVDSEVSKVSKKKKKRRQHRRRDRRRTERRLVSSSNNVSIGVLTKYEQNTNSLAPKVLYTAGGFPVVMMDPENDSKPLWETAGTCGIILVPAVSSLLAKSRKREDGRVKDTPPQLQHWA